MCFQQEPLGIDNVDLCYFDSSFSVFETMVYPVIECSLIGVIPFFVWLFLVIYTAKEFCEYNHIIVLVI